MRAGERKQQSYEKGIVENWQQDSFKEPHGLLYLENYNPNLEVMSLIKRYGERIIVYKNKQIIFDTSAYTHNVFGYPSNREIVLSNEAMLTSNPDYNKTFISFLKRKPIDGTALEKDGLNDTTLLSLTPECTAVVAHVIENELGTDTLDWHEPFIDQATYPGWYTVGLYTDHIRFGEKLFFTTLLDEKPYGTDLDKYLFPVYEWGLWDLTKKRKNGKTWWNGIDFTNLDTDKETYRKWKVKAPTMNLLRGDRVGYAYWDKSSSQWLRNGNEKDIEICFMENDLDVATANSVNYDVPGDVTLHGILHLTSDNSNGTLVNKRSSFLALDNDDRYPHLSDMSVYANNNDFYGSYDIMDNEEYENAIKAAINTVTGNTYDIVEGQVTDFTYSYKYNEDVGIDEWRVDMPDPTVVRKNIDPLRVAVSKTFFGHSGEQVDDVVRAEVLLSALPHLYLRYIDAGVPRPFHKNEQIPFVLTAKVNGVETVIYQDIYEIKSQQGMAIPNHFYLETLDIDYVKANSINAKWAFLNEDYRTFVIPTVSAGNVEVRTVPGLASYMQNYACPHAEVIRHDANEVAIRISNMLQFTLKIKGSILEQLLEQDVTEINFYVAEKSDTEKLINVLGIDTIIETPSGYYMKPAITTVDTEDIEFDYTKFRLVKKFLIDGASQKIKYEKYRGGPTHSNAWLKNGDYYFAVPDVENDTISPLGTGLLPYFENTYDKYGMIYNEPGQNNERMWYSDFTLWDYPLDAPPLTLNNSAKYWKGLGAKHIEIIQGRTFISGTIDEDGVEEQAVVRFSAVQNGVASKDIFVEEDEITFGHSPITALLNYRDQLWVFGENSQYRMLPHNIFDVSSWEMLDVQHAQGCLSHKTLTVTPHGVAFASKNGIWISDGRMPSSLTDNPSKGLAIQSLYQNLIMNKAYVYREQADPGEVYTDPDTGVNPYLELYYDKEKNELILSTPVKKSANEVYEPAENDFTSDEWERFTHELRLIYSFAQNNWRIETYRCQMTRFTSPGTANHKTYSKNGVFHLADNDLTIVKECYPVGTPALSTPNTYSNSEVTFNIKDVDYIYDEITRLTITDTAKIYGEMITHELGDGENDFVLRKAYLENSPRDKSIFDKELYGYKDFYYDGADGYTDMSTVVGTPVFEEGDIKKETNGNFYIYVKDSTGTLYWQILTPLKDPYILYELRNRSWLSQSDFINYQDIVSLNLYAKGGRNPFMSLSETPADTNYGPSDKVVGRESLVMLFPRNTKFRRARFKIISEIISKIRSFTIEFAGYKRRSK